MKTASTPSEGGDGALEQRLMLTEVVQVGKVGFGLFGTVRLQIMGNATEFGVRFAPQR
jgi:hypothetical protein